MAIVVSKEEKILRERRRQEFNLRLEKYKVKTRKLALLTGIEETNLTSYKTGKLPISENVWEKINKGFENLDHELLLNLPNIEVESWNYVAQSLMNNNNVSINKKRIKDPEQYLIDLKLNGFDCSYEIVNGDYVFSTKGKSRPMVEKVINPNKKEEFKNEQIANYRKSHEFALKLESAKEVTEQMKVTTCDPIDVDKSENELKWSEEITLTEEDTVEHNQNTMHSLPTEEEVELKELADEVIANCGIEKGIHSVDLVEFLETRLTKQEVRGYLRGKAIESLLEDDYQTASMCIKYFMDNGYIPEEMRL